MAKVKICNVVVDNPKRALEALQKTQLKKKPNITNSVKSASAEKKQTQLKETPAALTTPVKLPPKHSPVPVTYDPDLKHFHDQYKVKNEIGTGGYGKVYSATRKSDNQMVAIKQMLLSNIQDWSKDPDTKKNIPTEVVLLHRCQAADEVIRLFEYIESKTHAFIVMERPADFFDLFNFITHLQSQKKRLSLPIVCHVIRQITQTLAKCHSFGVVHRDLKQENVLIHRKSGDIKLLDFGLAQFMKNSNERFSLFRGTAVYRPPEYITAKESFADSLTVWSIGCFAYSLFFGDVPFETDDEIVAGITTKEAQMNTLPHDPRDFILQCLHPNPNSRPLLQSLVNHPWISLVSVPSTQPKKRPANPRCSYEVVEIGERPSNSTSNSNVENSENRDPRIYMKLRRTNTK